MEYVGRLLMQEAWEKLGVMSSEVSPSFCNDYCILN